MCVCNIYSLIHICLFTVYCRPNILKNEDVKHNILFQLIRFFLSFLHYIIVYYLSSIDNMTFFNIDTEQKMLTLAVDQFHVFPNTVFN